MERLDGLVAGLGVLVVAVALAGVLTSGPGNGAFQVAFVEQRSALPAQQGTIAGDGSVDIPIRITAQNVTRLSFTVRIAGAGPRAAPDTIEVSLAGPGQPSEAKQGTLAGPGSQAEASLVFNRSTAPVPPSRTAAGATSDAALASLPTGLTSNNATGTWTLHIQVRSGGPVAQLHTESHSVSVETAVTAYRAVVQPQPANPR